MFNKKLTAMAVALAMIIVSINFVFAAQYEYDALGRLIKVDYNESKKADYSYDAGGNIKKHGNQFLKKLIYFTIPKVSLCAIY